ncbi:hypothetical protein ACFST9_00430 [Hymenobacter monticola]|uniref:Uncharacterized protein n=1 Tax=Hymenobacter monticola TaxID=1705399 RepID=A0ABY4B795_9BACT|nr:hypothetical protein [Hymenobacter monticola]UOE33571.1 hypothetical protein MTP16_20910 [Hymenobacter monticola]
MRATTFSRRWLLALVPCLALRCGTNCDDCYEPPCAGQYLGGLSLRPGSLGWLPAPAPDSLRFINSNGYRAVLDRVPPPASPDSVTLPAFLGSYPSYEESVLNPQAAPCEAYFRARRVVQHYRGRGLNLDLRFNLFKDLTGTASAHGLFSRAAADTLPDMVVLVFNQQYTAGFPVARAPYRQPRPTALGGTAVFLDSVRLAGRTFFGVYQFSRVATGAAVQPQRFFLRPGQGLVGFTYSNNEQWARF